MKLAIVIVKCWHLLLPEKRRYLIAIVIQMLQADHRTTLCGPAFTNFLNRFETLGHRQLEIDDSCFKIPFRDQSKTKSAFGKVINNITHEEVRGLLGLILEGILARMNKILGANDRLIHFGVIDTSDEDTAPKQH